MILLNTICFFRKKMVQGTLRFLCRLPGKALFCTVLIFILGGPALAEVSLPKIFADNMVLQRNREVPVWGWADPGEAIIVRIAGQVLKTRADSSGSWMVRLRPEQVGGPHKLEVQGRNTIRLQNVLFGEVWICSGQSNMEWRVINSKNASEEIASADYPEIRLFTVTKDMDTVPRRDIKGGTWQVSSPETVSDFSAVGYFFGRHLHQHLGVPVGLINASWGGTGIETWTSAGAYKEYKPFKEMVSELEDLDFKQFQKDAKNKQENWLARIEMSDLGSREGEKGWQEPGYDWSDWQTMNIPQSWEEQGLETDGIVWFKKTSELNREQASGALTLHLGPIDDRDITYINGIRIGEAEGYNANRSYEIPASVLQAGLNIITVRIKDTGGDGGFRGTPEQLYLETGSGNIALAGPWHYKLGTENLPPRPSGVGPNSKPSLLFNTMIYPLMPFAIQGAIWYQGEHNVSEACRYRELLPMMIRDWRKQWGQGEFPFLIAQLANYRPQSDVPGESWWAELREAQHMALSEPNTGMAVTIDIGNARDIHPRNKQDVGKRLALAARNIAYGESLVYSGPVYESMRIKKDKVILEFGHVGEGLKTLDGEQSVKAFAIAGEDQTFKGAETYIRGKNKVVVYSEEVKAPVAVRYAWADNPGEVNLYNSADLPASPFRTDQWEGITCEKMHN